MHSAPAHLSQSPHQAGISVIRAVWALAPFLSLPISTRVSDLASGSYATINCPFPRQQDWDLEGAQRWDWDEPSSWRAPLGAG